MGKAPAFCP
jgi:hypothetical protein